MSPRTPETYQQIKDVRREAIVAAARHVFARNGLAGARISDIAAQARISQGLLYHYFGSKEVLFTAIVEEALRETAALTTRALRQPGSAWERLERLCQEMLAGVLESPEYPLVILQAFTSETVPDEARAAVRTYGAQTMRDLVALVRAGQEQGQVAEGDPVELAVTFTACIQGAALSRLQGSGSGASALRSETLLRLLRA